MGLDIYAWTSSSDSDHRHVFNLYGRHDIPLFEKFYWRQYWPLAEFLYKKVEKGNLNFKKSKRLINDFNFKLIELNMHDLKKLLQYSRICNMHERWNNSYWRNGKHTIKFCKWATSQKRKNKKVYMLCSW